jgi:hypothetical protein
MPFSPSHLSFSYPAGLAALVERATKSREQQAYEAARAAAVHEDPDAGDIAITVGSGWDRLLQVVYAYGVAVYGFYTLYADPTLCPEARAAPFYALMRVLVWAYVVVPTGDVIMYLQTRARAREWTHNYDVAQVCSSCAACCSEPILLIAFVGVLFRRLATGSRCRGCP